MTPEEMLTRTAEIHRELVDMWGLSAVYLVNLSIFPNHPAYDDLPLDEIMGGVDNDIPMKSLAIKGGEYDRTSITFYGTQP